MIRQAYEFEIITPCFAGGANPETTAEIRAASIRGQLRWWFRVLGGFKSLKEKYPKVCDQETLIFGSATGEEGNSRGIGIRLLPIRNHIITQLHKQSEMQCVVGYLLFPTRQKPRHRIVDATF